MEYCMEMTDYQLSISLLQDFSVLKDFDCGIEAIFPQLSEKTKGSDR